MSDNGHILVFDQARVLFRGYGTVRGNSTEFAYFKKTHRDWKKVLPLLEPAIRDQIKQRAKDKRYWKNFKTWIYNRCWEEEYPSSKSPEQDAEVLRVTELTKVAAEDRAKERRLAARKYRRNSLQSKE